MVARNSGLGAKGFNANRKFMLIVWVFMFRTRTHKKKVFHLRFVWFYSPHSASFVLYRDALENFDENAFFSRNSSTKKCGWKWMPFSNAWKAFFSFRVEKAKKLETKNAVEERISRSRLISFHVWFHVQNVRGVPSLLEFCFMFYRESSWKNENQNRKLLIDWLWLRSLCEVLLHCILLGKRKNLLEMKQGEGGACVCLWVSFVLFRSFSLLQNDFGFTDEEKRRKKFDAWPRRFSCQICWKKSPQEFLRSAPFILSKFNFPFLLLMAGWGGVGEGVPNIKCHLGNEILAIKPTTPPLSTPTATSPLSSSVLSAMEPEKLEKSGRKRERKLCAPRWQISSVAGGIPSPSSSLEGKKEKLASRIFMRFAISDMEGFGEKLLSLFKSRFASTKRMRRPSKRRPPRMTTRAKVFLCQTFFCCFPSQFLFTRFPRWFLWLHNKCTLAFTFFH